MRTENHFYKLKRGKLCEALGKHCHARGALNVRYKNSIVATHAKVMAGIGTSFFALIDTPAVRPAAPQCAPSNFCCIVIKVCFREVSLCE